MTLKETENSILDDLGELQDVLLRSEFLIRCGKVFEGIPENERRQEDLERNCQTKTWVQMETAQGKLFIRADSISLIVRGALSLIHEIYNERRVEEIAQYICGLHDSIEFSSLFSLDEQKGLRSITDRIKAFCASQL